jgi:Phosphotransferase enzyme family
MLTHAVFSNLFLHADDELSDILGSPIVDRRTIHEWPLSVVQRVQLEDGCTLVYKSQRPPTVEMAFYDRAFSSLLPGHRSLGKLGDCDIMTLDWIDAPLLSTIATQPAEMAEHGRRVIDEIAKITAIDDGDVPVYLDVGTIDAWSANARNALHKMRTLVIDRRFASLTLDAVDRLTTWSEHDDVLDAIAANPRVTHGDLKGDQVFVTETGYRVIDWQRPLIAPAEIDLVSLLVEQQMKPYGLVDITIIRIFWFLRLCWAIEAQHDLFPDFTSGPFERWARRATMHILT